MAGIGGEETAGAIPNPESYNDLLFHNVYFTSDSSELVAATADRVVRFRLTEDDDPQIGAISR